MFYWIVISIILGGIGTASYIYKEDVRKWLIQKLSKPNLALDHGKVIEVETSDTSDTDTGDVEVTPEE